MGGRENKLNILSKFWGKNGEGKETMRSKWFSWKGAMQSVYGGKTDWLNGGNYTKTKVLMFSVFTPKICMLNFHIHPWENVCFACVSVREKEREKVLWHHEERRNMKLHEEFAFLFSLPCHLYHNLSCLSLGLLLSTQLTHKKTTILLWFLTLLNGLLILSV